MARVYKLFLITFFLSFFAACGPEPMTEDMVNDEPANEVEAEVKAMEEAPLNIPSVSEEVVDENESPIEVAEPEPATTEPEIIEDVETEAAAENNVTEPDAAPVEVLPEDTNTTADGTIELEDANATAEEAEPVVETPPFEPYVEQIGVLKIGIEASAVRLMMKDPIIKYFALTQPDRIVIDFKDIRYLEPMVKAVEAPLVSQIATATHDNYNRVVIYLKEAKQFTISKNRGDWLIDLK